jgi:ribosome-binding factor A
MTSEARARRIATRMQEEMAEILRREASDPRLAGLTVTGIDVDRELAHATIHVTTVDPGDHKVIMTALIRAAGFFRTELARRIPLRSFPKLHFRWDASAERGARIEDVLAKLKREEAARGEKGAAT